MKNTDTIFATPAGKTAYQLRHNKGCFSGSTFLGVDQVKAAIKGIDRPTSRERAAAKRDAIRATEREVIEAV